MNIYFFTSLPLYKDLSTKLNFFFVFCKKKNELFPYLFITTSEMHVNVFIYFWCFFFAFIIMIFLSLCYMLMYISP